jgi:hypothetical protein
MLTYWHHYFYSLRNPNFFLMLMILQRFGFLSMLLFLLSSCISTRYQVYTMQSHLNKDHNREFAMEVDTLAIAYSFVAPSGSITIGIFNTSDAPMFINWRNSAVIVNGRSVPLVFFNGMDSEVIPPKSQVSISAPIDVLFIENYRNQPNIEKSYLIDEGIKRAYHYISYSQFNSPLKVRTFLVLSRRDSFDQTQNLQHEFWASTVSEFRGPPPPSVGVFIPWQQTVELQSATTANQVVLPGNMRPDRFYVTGTSNSEMASVQAMGCTIVGVFGLLGLMAALAQE